MSKVRKQRLRTLENEIRKLAKTVEKTGIQIGQDLIEIRDDKLYAEDEYLSWNEYLKKNAEELTGRSFGASKLFIRSAEIASRVPENIRSDVRPNLAASHLNELGRLAPVTGKKGSAGSEKDYSRIPKTDVARVLKSAATASKDGKPSVRDIRKAVDAELGIDRGAKSKAAKDSYAEENNKPNLAPRLRDMTGKIEAWTEMLAVVPADSWTLLEKDEPGLVKCLATACNALAELLRS